MILEDSLQRLIKASTPEETLKRLIRYLESTPLGRDATVSESTAFTDSYKTQEKFW